MTLATIYTIGHSTRELADFLALLAFHEIKILVDIRSLPASRRLPHFNHDALRASLPQAGIAYVWEKDLGGRRNKQQLPAAVLEALGIEGPGSPNNALRNPSFRNYADYMLTPPFSAGIARLLALAEGARTAIMCAEGAYFRCHRMLVSDYLAAHGHSVLHITGAVSPRPHKMMAEAAGYYTGSRSFRCDEQHKLGVPGEWNPWIRRGLRRRYNRSGLRCRSQPGKTPMTLCICGCRSWGKLISPSARGSITGGSRLSTSTLSVSPPPPSPMRRASLKFSLISFTTG